MWLATTALGLGAYWSTPKSIYAAQDFLNLNEGEKCLGFFYLGDYDGPALPGNREPLEPKVTWLE